MLWLEEQVVSALTANESPQQQAAIAHYVDGCLRAMPEVLRLGVAAESLLFGTATRVAGRFSPKQIAVARCLKWCERSPVDVIRQYPRLFNSLVVFASLELDSDIDRHAEPTPVRARNLELVELHRAQ